MGRLIYDDTAGHIVIDDDTLAHLKVVIATKLRRQESFTISWRHADEEPNGRSTIWLHPAIPLRFVFEQVDAPPLDEHRIEEMMRAASSTGGLVLDLSAARDERGLPAAI